MKTELQEITPEINTFYSALPKMILDLASEDTIKSDE
jgi:NAD(P)H-dependent FMN reductase